MAPSWGCSPVFGPLRQAWRFTACGPSDGTLSCDLPTSNAQEFTIHRDPGGTLWMHWQGTLFRVDGESSTPREIFTLPTTDRVTGMVSDQQGRLWILTEGSLWQGWWTPAQDHRPFLEVTHGIRSLGVDDQGTVWALRGHTLGQLDGGDFHAVEPVEETAYGSVGVALVQDPRQGLWLGSAVNGKLYRFMDGQMELVAQADGFLGGLDHDELAFAPDGTAWAAWGGHLLRDGVPVAHVDPPFRMTSVVSGRQGTLWAASNAAGGLHAFHPERVETLTEGLPYPAVLRVYEDLDGTLWTGDRHLVALRPGATRFEVEAACDRYFLGAILRRRGGDLWVGLGWGVTPVGSSTVELPDQFANVLLEDSNETLWAGTYNGLFRRIDAGDGLWERVAVMADGATPLDIRGIRETDDGALWLVTPGNGVVRFLDGEATAFNRARGHR